jgi:hypothetical protein
MSNENVVSLFDRKPKKKVEKKIDKEFDFENIMKRNSESKDRLSTDRKKSNKGVIRSNRLKN